ncbi:hypothetical protein Q766_01085 [Flavobacterium subsaxonicum WB 4.1-42 = DSM 21790]|uniref:Uncharacterized protein n=1 Tax=Flavobacterium subsaxonicum WB 4.1-42 = DSM 21790 TaxID=1121898 RepID=A0A0A2MQ07_9FLAO|nr:hypothetical protein Q766_01085 [Flavobacterium subsaxonicum WB 4.1-42 = DSM 21790]
MFIENRGFKFKFYPENLLQEPLQYFVAKPVVTLQRVKGKILMRDIAQEFAKKKQRFEVKNYLL